MGRLLEENGLSFVAFSPLHQGILLDKYDAKKPPVFEPGDIRSQDPKFQARDLEWIRPFLDRLKSRFGQGSARLASVALGYVLHYPRVACVIPGFRNARQVEDHLAAAEPSLSGADVDWIRQEVAQLI